MNFGRVNGDATICTFPLSFTVAYQLVTGMVMQGWAVANHSVGILSNPVSALTCVMFRMEENGKLASGMNAMYIAIGF